MTTTTQGEHESFSSNRLGFLTARAWMDEDGVHVWTAHDCKEGRVTTMLPFSTWQAVQRDGGRYVHPSVHCLACGYHDPNLEIGEPMTERGVCSACDHEKHAYMCDAQVYIAGKGVSTCDCLPWNDDEPDGGGR